MLTLAGLCNCCIESEGTRLVRSLRSRICARAMVSALATLTATGTSSRLAARLVAVTTIVPPAPSAAPSTAAPSSPARASAAWAWGAVTRPSGSSAAASSRVRAAIGRQRRTSSLCSPRPCMSLWNARPVYGVAGNTPRVAQPRRALLLARLQSAINCKPCHFRAFWPLMAAFWRYCCACATSSRQGLLPVALVATHNNE